MTRACAEIVEVAQMSRRVLASGLLQMCPAVLGREQLEQGNDSKVHQGDLEEGRIFLNYHCCGAEGQSQESFLSTQGAAQ